ncbi:hypothetical protein [Phenylobacterium sp.]|jgi:hypothetical protein|uniref:hypothetical protein n=1 Tax=Phenylobacterium sp. TaxID=1871053 RepID=UPI002F93CCB0
MSFTDTGLRPFAESGYEILDDDLEARREVTIWSVDPLVPRLGDLFIVERDGLIHDVVVIEIAVFRGGWSAVCRVVEVYE